MCQFGRFERFHLFIVVLTKLWLILYIARTSILVIARCKWADIWPESAILKTRMTHRVRCCAMARVVLEKILVVLGMGMMLVTTLGTVGIVHHLRHSTPGRNSATEARIVPLLVVLPVHAD